MDTTGIENAVIASLNRHVKELESVIEHGQSANNDLRCHVDAQGRRLVAFMGVSAPPPSADDYQVSLENAPDFDIAHFSGGVEKIDRVGCVLMVHFVNGGRICVPNPVTYHAPESH